MIEPAPDGGIEIFNHQHQVPVPRALLDRLLDAARRAWPLVGEHARGHAPLAPEDQLEISLLDDAAIAKVHEEFMDIPGATDVITFEHGEILISLETAARQAAEYDEPFEREIFRYIVHGMLHLAGHDDAQPDERAAMEAAQEAIVAAIWPLDY